MIKNKHSIATTLEPDKAEQDQGSGIVTLENHDYDLVFGGGWNDCICIRTNPHRTSVQNPERLRFTMIGHHNITSEAACVGICCTSERSHGYKYAGKYVKKCPSIVDPMFYLEINEPMVSPGFSIAPMWMCS